MFCHLKQYTFEEVFKKYKEMNICFNGKNIRGVIESVLKEKFIFLVGESGVGKTYALIRMGKLCLDEKLAIPIFLSSYIFEKEFTNFNDLIKHMYAKNLTSEEINYLSKHVKNSTPCIILIDAINETNLSTQRIILNWVSQMLTQGFKIVISSQKLLENTMDIRLKQKTKIMEVSSENIHEEVLKFAYDYFNNNDDKIKKLDYIGQIENTLIGILIVYYLDECNNNNVKLSDIFIKIIIQILNFRNRKAIDFDYVFAIEILSRIVYWHYVENIKITPDSLVFWVALEENLNLIKSVFKSQKDFFCWICDESIFNRIDTNNLVLIHEKLGDFLIALKIYNTLSSSNYNSLISFRLFHKDVTIKISAFLTDLLLNNDNIENIKNNLLKLYLDSKNLVHIDKDIVIRQQAAFYLGIIGEHSPEIRIKEDCAVIQRAFIVGEAISGYNIGDFINYCHVLTSDEFQKMVNICYTLIHQGDYRKYNENSFETFPIEETECENALKGMIRQLLKNEYEKIDILAIITLNDYYQLFKEKIDEILLLWYNWNHSIKERLKCSIVNLYEIYQDDKILRLEVDTFTMNFLK